MFCILPTAHINCDVFANFFQAVVSMLGNWASASASNGKGHAVQRISAIGIVKVKATCLWNNHTLWVFMVGLQRHPRCAVQVFNLLFNKCACNTNGHDILSVLLLALFASAASITYVNRKYNES